MVFFLRKLDNAITWFAINYVEIQFIFISLFILTAAGCTEGKSNKNNMQHSGLAHLNNYLIYNMLVVN